MIPIHHKKRFWRESGVETFLEESHIFGFIYGATKARGHIHDFIGIDTMIVEVHCRAFFKSKIQCTLSVLEE